MQQKLMQLNLAISVTDEKPSRNTNPQVFVPASGVRHRPLKTKTGIERDFLSKKKPKKGRAHAYKLCM